MNTFNRFLDRMHVAKPVARDGSRWIGYTRCPSILCEGGAELISPEIPRAPRMPVFSIYPLPPAPSASKNAFMQPGGSWSTLLGEVEPGVPVIELPRGSELAEIEPDTRRASRFARGVLPFVGAVVGVLAAASAAVAHAF